MYGEQTTTRVLGIAGVALLVLGIAAAGALVWSDPKSAVRRSWARYEAELDRELRFLFYKTTAAKIARTQLGIGAALAVYGLLAREFFVIAAIALVALAPRAILRRRHAERVLRIEGQLDAWLLILANALKAVPSIGEALSSSAKLMREPISQELDLVLKEVHLGTPLDQAVMNMSNRIGSRSAASALATLLIGRQTGGDLGKILEKSATTLREMTRLKDIVRTKTAESKGQTFVLAMIPFVLIGLIHWVDEHWLDPLLETTVGYAIIGIAFVLWFSAILLARKILEVDI